MEKIIYKLNKINKELKKFYKAWYWRSHSYFYTIETQADSSGVMVAHRWRGSAIAAGSSPLLLKKMPASTKKVIHGCDIIPNLFSVFAA